MRNLIYIIVRGSVFLAKAGIHPKEMRSPGRGGCFKSVKYYGLIGLCFLLACTKVQPSKQAVDPLPPTGMAGAQKVAPKGAVVEKVQLAGVVLEVKTHDAFSFVRLQVRTPNQTEKWHWVALVNSNLQKGEQIQVEADVLQKNFHSKGLDKTFGEIYFGRIIAPGGV